MKTCDKCKYWNGGYCKSDKFVDTSAEWEDVERKDSLEYYDKECYGAGFKTGPKFGCIHWSD